MVTYTTPIPYDIIQGHEYQEVGVTGHHFRGCLPCRNRSWKDGEQYDGFKTVKITSKVWPQGLLKYFIPEIDTLSHLVTGGAGEPHLHSRPGRLDKQTF